MNATTDTGYAFLGMRARFWIPCAAVIASATIFGVIAHYKRNMPENEMSHAIYRAVRSEKLNLARSGFPSYLVNVNGLSAREAWGRWSDSNEVEFEFKTPLPSDFTFSLFEPYVIPPNIGRSFSIVAGDIERTFQVRGPNETVSVHFTNVRDAYSIKIIVPVTVSYKSLGLGEDTRELGIGLAWIHVSGG